MLRYEFRECTRCGGRGWGSWEPDGGICYGCGGTGDRKCPIWVYGNRFERAWKVTQPETPAAYTVTYGFVDKRGGFTAVDLTIVGIDAEGIGIDIKITGEAPVKRALARLEANDLIEKTVTRDTLVDHMERERALQRLEALASR